MHKTTRSIYARDRGICHLCGDLVVLGSKDLIGASRDHIIPKAKGGSLTPDNLRLAHIGCNTLRGTMTVDEFRLMVKRLRSNSDDPIYLYKTPYNRALHDWKTGKFATIKV